MALEFLNLRRGKLRRGITGIPDSPSAYKQKTLGTEKSMGYWKPLLVEKDHSGDNYDSGSGKGTRDLSGDDNMTRQGSLKIPGGER